MKLMVPWASNPTMLDVVARALYEHGIHQPGCITAEPWERAPKGVKGYHTARAAVALEAVDKVRQAGMDGETE